MSIEAEMIQALMRRLLHEAQERWPIESEIPREEIVAWLDSRTTHWIAGAEANKMLVETAGLERGIAPNNGRTCDAPEETP